jgi:hypothetical protein
MSLPAPARKIASATTDAVAAARGGDLPGFEEATTRLAGSEPEQVRLVLGAAVRQMLEDSHPDGLAGDDLLELIKNCARASFGWYPQIDVQALVVVVTGAMGVQEPDEEPRRFTPAEVAVHAPLFIAELLKQQPDRLAHYVNAALAQIAEEQLNELP